MSVSQKNKIDLTKTNHCNILMKDTYLAKPMKVGDAKL